MFGIALLLLVVAPLVIIGNTIHVAVLRHNNEATRSDMGEW